VATEGTQDEQAEVEAPAQAAPAQDGDGRNILLRPDDWNPTVAAALVFVVVAIVLFLVALLLIGAFTDTTTPTTSNAPPAVVLSPRLKQVSTCLADAGVTVSADGLDFVAQNALGGALKAPMQGNVVTVSDGLAPAGAVGIVHGYERLSGDLDLPRLLHRNGRFVLLWGGSPTRRQTRLVDRCLR
jgi:hypothetical protein